MSTEQYAPRKCSATNRILTSSDHAAVQINIGHLDANGVYNGQFTTVAFSGFLRGMAESDHALNRISSEAGLAKDLITGFPQEHKFRREE